MGWSMGWDVKDDGRTLRPVQKDEYEYAGGISEMPALVPPSDARQAFLFRDQKLIPEALQVHSKNFAATEWEAQYSNLTGSGDKQSFTPVINDSHRIVGHLGWIVINEIYVSKDTIAEGTPTAVALEMARLAEWHRQRVWSHNHPINFFGAQPARGTKPPVPCWPANRSSGASLKPLLSEADRKSFLNGPGVDPSDELRLRENMNFYLAGGGKAIVGQVFAWEFQDHYIGERRTEYGLFNPDSRAVLPPTQFCDCWGVGIYRCLALVAPNGHLQEVFEVQKIHFESRAERADRIALQVLDIALTIWMMIDMVTIPVALFSLAGRLLAREVMIEAVRVTVRGEVKAAVDLALRMSSSTRLLTDAEIEMLIKAGYIRKFSIVGVPQLPPAMRTPTFANKLAAIQKARDLTQAGIDEYGVIINTNNELVIGRGGPQGIIFPKKARVLGHSHPAGVGDDMVSPQDIATMNPDSEFFIDPKGRIHIVGKPAP